MKIDRLARSWLLLLGLSVVTLLFARHGEGSLGVAGTALLLAVAAVKGREILMQYLELNRAGTLWRVLLSGYLAVLCGAILLVYAAGALGWADFPGAGR